MHRRSAMAIAALMLTLTATQATAQNGRKAPPKKPAPTSPIVLGTPQLPGDNGKLNQAYTLGFDTPAPLNFALLKAEYSAGRLVRGGYVHVPKRDEKLLLLDFTIQNPNKGRDLLVRFDSIRITAVDSKDVNHPWVGTLARAGETKDTYGGTLKPGQKVELVSAIVVPADLSVPKLIVERFPSKRVLRYDMRGFVRPLPTAYADPKDSTGACAVPDIPGEANTFYAAGRFDVQLKSATLVDSVGALKPRRRGDRFLVATLAFRNACNSQWLLRGDSFPGAVTLGDGSKVERTRGIYMSARDEPFGQRLEPGEEVTARYIVDVPANAEVSRLAVWEGLGHHIVFDLGGLK